MTELFVDRLNKIIFSVEKLNIKILKYSFHLKNFKSSLCLVILCFLDINLNLLILNYFWLLIAHKSSKLSPNIFKQKPEGY